MKICDICKSDDWVDTVKIPMIDEFDACFSCRRAIKDAVMEWRKTKDKQEATEKVEAADATDTA